MPKRNMSKGMKRVTLTVDPDAYEAISRLADKSNVSTSWLVRRSMRLFLE
ncbi:MAG: ribbon-helix-helix protein, CopG family [Thiotrichales bacterium]|nr:ribbon-helix-helix protein, CopG family [Thiotrichales bacterium]